MNRRIPKLAALPWLLSLWLLPASSWADPVHQPAVNNSESAELMGYVPGASRLEGRIRAPCCWNQTLDIHGSEVSNQLRREIRRRLLAGETPDAIEASIVQRYGEKVLAVPEGNPLKSVAILLSLSMAGVGVAGFFMLRRWKARGQAHSTKAKAQEPKRDPSLDARLDAELKALDD